MNRRGFLGAILAAGAAPWVAKAGVLMPVKTLVTPEILTLERLQAIRRQILENAWPSTRAPFFLHAAMKEWVEPNNPDGVIFIRKPVPYQRFYRE